MGEAPTSGPPDARRRPPKRTDPSLLLLGGISVLCAVFAIATVVAAGCLFDATGVAWLGGTVVAAGAGALAARLRRHRLSEVVLGAVWALATYVFLTGALLIVATVAVGDSLS